MAKKKNSTRFPKRIAGVKIPRQLRRVANSPVGGPLIAAGVLVAAYKVATSEKAQALYARLRDEAARADAAFHAFTDRTSQRDYAGDYRDRTPN